LRSQVAVEDWLTMRVGRATGHVSRARFFLDSPGEVATMLERMISQDRMGVVGEAPR
jgi:hypothetical protein